MSDLRHTLSTAVVAVTVLAGCCDSQLAAPPAKDDYGTHAEIGTRGDTGNPGELFGGTFRGDREFAGKRQERAIGGDPARFSGWTTWVNHVERVPATRFVNGYRGDYLKVSVTIFNRDVENQTTGADDFSATHDGSGAGRSADFVGAPELAAHHEFASGDTLSGDLYFYIGDAGTGFIVYSVGDSASTGVWRFGS